MSEERFEGDTEAKDEDVEAHKHTAARKVEATDEPGTDESDDVEAHARRASHREA